MRILLLGGTRFMGPLVVERLVDEGHEVAVFHRGQTNNLRHTVAEIISDRNDLNDHATALRDVQADVVIDMIPHDVRHAEGVLQVLASTASQIVAISSGNIYRGFAMFNGEVEGPPSPGALVETSPLRDTPVEGDDKRGVEQTLLAQQDIPSTILRLPMVYGPGDPQHRLFDILRRVQDGRQAILVERGLGDCVLPRGYVENVAQAICLAATTTATTHRIYNVADASPLRERQWIQAVTEAMDWQGAVVLAAMDQLPEHLLHGANTTSCIEMDSAKIRDELGFTDVVAPAEAIRRTIEWELAHPPDQLQPIDYAAEDLCLRQLGHAVD